MFATASSRRNRHPRRRQAHYVSLGVQRHTNLRLISQSAAFHHGLGNPGIPEIPAKFSFDTGYDVAAALGWKWYSGLRTELELSWRSAPFDRVNSIPWDGRERVGSAMGNVLYDINTVPWHHAVHRRRCWRRVTTTSVARHRTGVECGSRRSVRRRSDGRASNGS